MKRKSYLTQPIGKYSGKGTLSFEDGYTRKCRFRAWQDSCGDIVLLCHKYEKDQSVLATYPTRFEGKTYDGRRIVAEGGFSFYPYHASSQGKIDGSWDAFRIRTLSVYNNTLLRLRASRFGITNLDLFGTEKIDHRVGSTHRKQPVQLKHMDESWSIEIIPLPDFMHLMGEVQRKRGVCVTCEIIVPISEETDSHSVQQMISDLCSLLSVARGTKVQWVYCDNYADSDTLISRVHYNNITRPYCPLRAIDACYDGGAATKVFIEKGFSRFRQLREPYRLNSGTIDLYLDAKVEQDYLHARGAKMVVAMEALKEAMSNASCDSSACSILDKEIFSRVNNAVKKVLKESNVEKPLRKRIYEELKGLNRRSFSDLITDLFDKIKLKTDDDEVEMFVNSRNHLVHRGSFYCNSTQSEDMQFAAIKEYFFLVNFMDRVFLKLLNYSGPYTDWRQPEGPKHSALE